MMDNSKAKQKETMLTLCVAFVLWHLLSKTHPNWMLYAGATLGAIGMFSDFLSGKIHWAWMRLAEGIGWVMNKVILSAVFYVFLFPFALMARMAGNNSMQLKRKSNTYYHTRNHTCQSKNLDKTW